VTLTAETPGSTTCRPRFCTPRDERFPTYGPQVGEVSRRLGRPLMPWQQELADVAYEYDPDTGLFRYKEVDGTVPRQSGKTTIILAKTVYRTTVMARALGPQRSTYTAQTRLAARKKLERDFSELLRASRSFREVPNAKARPTKATEWRLSLNNGSEAIQFGSGSFLQIDAPSRTGGHGDTLDDGTIDEAFAHEDDTVEGGMRPSMATRRNAQIWVFSTAGDARSKYLYRKVLAGRAASESGQHGSVCYAEYSAPDDADPGDPAVWRSCMPALGHTITEDFIRGEWERAQRKGQEGVDTFRRAYLNQWPDPPVLSDEGGWKIISQAEWSALAELEPRKPTSPVFGLALSKDQDHSSIAVAGGHPGGHAQLSVIDSRPGTGWVVERLAELCDKAGAKVALDKGGPAGSLLRDLEARRVPVIELAQGSYAQACGALLNEVNNRTVRHTAEPEFSTAVQFADSRPLNDRWAWARSGATDISPLEAATVALHGYRTQPTSEAWGFFE
jgi:phage terminase large subunit-like protein